MFSLSNLSHPAGFERIRFIRDGSAATFIVISTRTVLGEVRQDSAEWPEEQATRYHAELVAQGYRVA